MKFFRFASFLPVATLMIALAAGLASAADDDLPEPTDGGDEAVSAPAPEDALPDPSLGEGVDSLPQPGVDAQSENPKNVVNKPLESDDIFLPTPTAQESINYAPLGSPVSNRTVSDDWRVGMERRPLVSLHGGVAIYNYPSEAVEANRNGPTVGGSVRIFDIAQTIFLHAYGSVGWVKLGGVGPFTDVKDTVIHLGGLLEVGIGRRLSLFGSLLKRGHTLKSGPDASLQFGTVERYTDLINEGWKLGIGAQYDFYVIPHGSIGIRGHIEQDMGLVALTMAMEPRPRKKLSLNFSEYK
jgi:hypothetical protein